MNCAGRILNIVCAIGACALWLLFCISPATADITATGDIAPAYDDTDPWNVTGTPAEGVEGDLFIGISAEASLVISDGSQVYARMAHLAYDPSSAATVTVTGSGSLLECQYGVWAFGKTQLNILDGGRVVSSVGNTSVYGDQSNTIVVSGLGSRWDMVGEFYVGGNDSVVISNGGSISNGYGYARSDSPTIIDGAGSLWENRGELTVAGSAVTVTIRNGGRVTSSGAHIEAEGDGTPSVIVTGPGSTWQVNPGTYGLQIGGFRSGSLLIADGGRVQGDYVGIGSDSSEPSSVTISGTDSILQMARDVTLSGGSRMDITDGGQVTDSIGALFPGSGSACEAYVTGAGSLWENQRELYVGSNGNASLVISDGGRVTSNGAIVKSWGSTPVVIVTDPDSRWTNTGTLTLGEGGLLSHSYYGAVIVSNGGMVETDNMVVWYGGVLGGDGIVKAAQIANHGVIRPGTFIDLVQAPTLTIDGDLTMESSSVLETRIASSSPSAILSVTGDVDITGGTVRAIQAETMNGLHEYVIMEADSVSGQFERLDVSWIEPLAMLRIAGLSYETNLVRLTIAPTPFNDAAVGQTRNQRALGAALQTIANAGPIPVTSLLQQLPTLDGVRVAYDQLSGQSRPPLAPIAAMDSAKFLGIVSNRLQGARGIVADSLNSLSDFPLLAMALPDDPVGTPLASDVGLDGSLSERDLRRRSDGQDWGVWGKLYGLYGDRETENGTPGYSYNVFGQSFGFDLQFDEKFIGGVTGGYSNGQVDYDHLADTADIDATHAGLYGSYSADGWYLSGVATYSWLNFDTRRVVDLTGERHEGSFDGHEWSGYLEAGLDWQPAASWLVQPSAGLQATYLHLDEYTETGPSSALVYKDQDYESYRTSLGAKVTRELILGPHGRAAVVQARAHWVHEFGDVTSSVDARFEDVPSVWFTVSDEEVSRDSILLGAGTGIRLTRRLRAFVDYDASLNPDNTAQVISGAVEYRW